MLVAYAIVVIASSAYWMWFAISQGHQAAGNGGVGVDRLTDADRAKRNAGPVWSATAIHTAVVTDATGARAQMICEVP